MPADKADGGVGLAGADDEPSVLGPEVAVGGEPPGRRLRVPEAAPVHAEAGLDGKAPGT